MTIHFQVSLHDNDIKQAPISLFLSFSSLKRTSKFLRSLTNFHPSIRDRRQWLNGIIHVVCHQPKKKCIFNFNSLIFKIISRFFSYKSIVTSLRCVTRVTIYVQNNEQVENTTSLQLVTEHHKKLTINLLAQQTLMAVREWGEWLTVHKTCL